MIRDSILTSISSRWEGRVSRSRRTEQSALYFVQVKVQFEVFIEFKAVFQSVRERKCYCTKCRIHVRVHHPDEARFTFLIY